MSLAARLDVPETKGKGRGSRGDRSPRHSPYPFEASQIPKEGNWGHDKFAEVNDLPQAGGSLASRISSGTVASGGGGGGGGAKLFSRALGGSGVAVGGRGSAAGGRVASGGSLSIKGASAPPSTTVEIQELVAGTSADDVKMIFSECGAITDAWTIPSGSPETTTVRVKFMNRDSMAKAIQRFDQQQADGRTLSVKEVVAPSVKSVAPEVEMDVLDAPATSKGKMYSDNIDGGVTVTRPPKIDKIEEDRWSRGRGGREGGRGRGGRGGRGRGRGGDELERPYLDIYIGDEEVFKAETTAYQVTCNLLKKNATVYGLPDVPNELSEEQREILQDLHPQPLVFMPPQPLLAGRLIFALDPVAGLAKTRANFTSLCKGDKGMCKNAPNKPLHYVNVPIHRIVKGFIAQGGDVTRGDGSGGESIHGPKFADSKEGLKNKFKRGSLAMANSGKNSNSSQFFVTLADDQTSLAKLNGKYVCFGEVQNLGGEGGEVLDRLDAVAGDGDAPRQKVWIGSCGVL
ncbi:hypothetical protein FRB97_008749 [Tulasnella sp. 331]|nr:hypothetical protein FRB97_008749 [Tulasnella sp. 331]KAG8888076.1 hypothetical protein FRB98_008413 [Tulasnella sp. 332]